MADLRGAAGTSGIASLAQAMANQGQLQAQRASASIGMQESQIQRLQAAEASKITSAGISVHPGKDPKSPFEIIDIIESAGADISRVVICHIDRTYPNGEKVEELAKKGVYIEWDFFGIESSRYWLNDIELPIDRDRIKLIKKMFKLGYGNKILISHDICSKTRLHEWGGHGYGHIIRNIIPLMKNYGITNDQIDQLIRINPINLLSISNIN